MWNQHVDVAASVSLIQVPLLPKELKNGHHSCDPGLKKSDHKGLLMLLSLNSFLNTQKSGRNTSCYSCAVQQKQTKGRKMASALLLPCSLSVCFQGSPGNAACSFPTSPNRRRSREPAHSAEAKEQATQLLRLNFQQ